MGKIKELANDIEVLEKNMDKVPKELQGHLESVLEALNRAMQAPSTAFKGKTPPSTAIVAQDAYEGDD